MFVFGALLGDRSLVGARHRDGLVALLFEQGAARLLGREPLGLQRQRAAGDGEPDDERKDDAELDLGEAEHQRASSQRTTPGAIAPPAAAQTRPGPGAPSQAPIAAPARAATQTAVR